MRRFFRYWACCVACAALCAIPVRAATAAMPALAPETQNAIVWAANRELRAFGGRTPIPGVFIAMWIPGKAPFIQSVGYADVPSRRPFRLADKFRIGSNTKTFVVTTLLQLVDEKRLKLDDPLSTFKIGVTVPNADHITIRQLCEMRSGLFEAYNTRQFEAMHLTPQTHVDPRQLIRWAAQHKPLFAPGAKYNYSNTNYLLLGLIVESITHDTIINEIHRRLLVPMALNDTSFPLYDPAMPQPHSHGYGLTRAGDWEDVTVDVPPSATWAAGAMISTVPDMKRWVKSYVLGTMNSKAAQRQRLRCLPVGKDGGLGFGLGIGCSNGWYGYTGGLPGYHTAAYYLPSKDITLIAFVNAQREQPFPGAANAIVRDISRLITPNNLLFP